MDADQTLALMQQYEQEGKDLRTLISHYQTLTSSGKTLLGLNRWEKSDKPRMEDFNEDNRIIDEKLRELSAEKVDLPVRTDFKPVFWARGGTDGSYTFSEQVGISIKYQGFVLIYVSLIVESVITPATGQIVVRGFPDASGGGIVAGCSIANCVGVGDYTGKTLHVSYNCNGNFAAARITNGVTDGHLDAAAIKAGTVFRFSGWYPI